MSETIYLKDGRMADLITKTDKGYLVNPYITFNSYEDEKETIPGDNMELVKEIFKSAPIEVANEEVKKLRLEIGELVSEKLKVQSDVMSLQRQKTDLGKLIINRSELKNAKRIIVFEKEKIAPFIIEEGKRVTRLNISYQITQWEHKESAWSYELSYGDSWSNGQCFDEKYGIMFDLTDNEVMEITIKRQNEKGTSGFSDWIIKATEDKWLTPEMTERKKQVIKEVKEKEISNWVKKKEEAELEIKKLTKASELIA